ncbi:Plasmid partition protein ParA-like protein [Polymorphum gilvum SL003B-26A1]|uniref:Plasmid partition protein ParA-like protein n=1 Tax=Polymorphum gilvum (strain LMG 25793 / CGMCC 1.9160 / SL003B-26A1) TaxID=991905 RepID=F2IUL6_POLGS|nr:Plasmid partition protein ParA-like protein [Polymorphum gilvum SL003B-26A1]
MKIADLDIQQGTSFNWQARRLQRGVDPVVAVERFGTVGQAIKAAAGYDLMILDGPPHATMGTLQIAEASTLVVLPTGLALDDLEPTILLAHELTKKGVPAGRIVIAFCRVGDSESELAEASTYVRQAGYRHLAKVLPEKTGFRRASDEGRAPTETRFPSLNERAEAIAHEIADIIQVNTDREAA